MTILRLNPMIELDTPRGRALAEFLIDYDQTNDLVWVTWVRETGECWCYRNKDVQRAADTTWHIRDSAAPGEAAGSVLQGGRPPAGATLAPAPLAPAGGPSQPCGAASQAPAAPAPPPALPGALGRLGGRPRRWDPVEAGGY